MCCCAAAGLTCLYICMYVCLLFLLFFFFSDFSCVQDQSAALRGSYMVDFLIFMVDYCLKIIITSVPKAVANSIMRTVLAKKHKIKNKNF